MTPETRPGSVDLREGHISYRSTGESGPAVVLLHGAGLDNSRMTWARLMRELAATHRLFAPDLPKHGASWPWHARADQRSQEDVLLRLLDHWGLGSATFVGLSLGAAISLGVALEHPERVERLVLASCGAIQDRVPGNELAYLSLRTPISWLITRTQSERTLNRFTRTRIPFSGVTPEEVDELAALMAEEFRAKQNGHMFSDWNRFEIAFRGMRSNFMPRLGAVTCPTLFVHGSDDDAVPLRYAREAADRVPGARLEVIDGASHFAPMDHPEQVNAAIGDFLADTRSSAVEE